MRLSSRASLAVSLGTFFVLSASARAAEVPGWYSTADLSFVLSDGRASIPVRHHGTAPDLFGEGRGAVVEGQWTGDGYFKAALIMAKHSEEYKAPHDTKESQSKAMLKTLEEPKR